MENEAEVFLNSVPLFSGLMREEKMLVVQALQEEYFEQGQWVIRQVGSGPRPCTRCSECPACGCRIGASRAFHRPMGLATTVAGGNSVFASCSCMHPASCWPAWGTLGAAKWRLMAKPQCQASCKLSLHGM